MLSERAFNCTRELRALRDEGRLTKLEGVYEQEGVALPLGVAVAIALDDLDTLTDQATAGIASDPQRWEYLGDELERLHRLATSTST